MSAEATITKLSRTLASTETLKLAEIHTNDIFYTPLEERFERITRMARRLLKVPVAAVTLLSHDKQWFKSVAGWVVSELPLAHSLCAIAVQDNQPCVVADTVADPRFMSHPLVVRKPKFRFYAGYPLRDENGLTIATFCVFDIKPRMLSSDDLQFLRDLGETAQRELLAEQLNDAQAELVSKLSAARREAMFDPLTRVWNRRGGNALLRATLLRAGDHQSDVSACLLDVDEFKRINDTYGHQIGDQVLRKLAATLVASLRPEDVVCRYGGDEFLLILPDADAKQAALVAERTRQAVSKSPVATRDGALPVTISIGYASYAPGETVLPEDLIRLIDEALITCKRDGRNRVRAAG